MPEGSLNSATQGYTEKKHASGSKSVENKYQPRREHRGLIWLALIALSFLLNFLLQELGVPGAPLIGPLIAGIVVALRFGSMEVPKFTYNSAQTIALFFTSSAITPELAKAFFADWPVFVSSVFMALTGALAIGVGMAKLQWLPPAEAVLGCAPGAAAIMLPIAESCNADVRLVAIMQYTRFLLVTLATAVVGQLYLSSTHASELVVSIGTSGFDPEQFVITLGMAAFAGFLGYYLPGKSTTFLFPLFFGVSLCGSGLFRFELPTWLVVPSFAVLGWSAGLQFNLATFRYAIRALPKMIIGGIALVVFCALIAFCLTLVVDIDLMSAFLATSPGGVDAAVVLAAGASVDKSFVAGLQITRLVLVMVFGPMIVRAMLKYFP